MCTRPLAFPAVPHALPSFRAQRHTALCLTVVLCALVLILCLRLAPEPQSHGLYLTPAPHAALHHSLHLRPSAGSQRWYAGLRHALRSEALPTHSARGGQSHGSVERVSVLRAGSWVGTRLIEVSSGVLMLALLMAGMAWQRSARAPGMCMCACVEGGGLPACGCMFLNVYFYSNKRRLRSSTAFLCAFFLFLLSRRVCVCVCVCVCVFLSVYFFSQPKDVYDCFAAPEEASPTAIFALLLHCFCLRFPTRARTRARVCVRVYVYVYVPCLWGLSL